MTDEQRRAFEAYLTEWAKDIWSGDDALADAFVAGWEAGLKSAKERKPKYGDRRDYPKIDIYVDNAYYSSTTWANSLKEAKEKFLEKYPDLLQLVQQIRCVYSNGTGRDKRAKKRPNTGAHSFDFYRDEE